MAHFTLTNKDILQRDLPTQDKLKLALQWLQENPEKQSTTAARLFRIEKEDSVRKALWRAKRKRSAHGGQNKILRPDQHEAMIRYATDQATNDGKGATKQMMCNCIMYLRTKENKSIPSWR
jgi:hypothetical protein